MRTIDIRQPMTAVEARTCANEIKRHMDGARALILQLYERDGWKALGYENWRTCVQQEFELSQSQLYRQLHAAIIEREISQFAIDGGDQLPETHLREIPKNLPPEQMWEAIETAKAIAPTPIASHVSRAVEAIKANVQPSASGTTLTVIDEASPHYGQQVVVVRAEGIVVQARTADGEATFLTNELGSKLPERTHRPNPAEAIEGALRVAEARIELLELKLIEACAFLEEAATLKGKRAEIAQWLNRVRSLLS